MQGVLSEIRRDAPYYGALGLYALASLGLAVWLGQVEKYQPFLYLTRWALGTVSAVSFGVVVVALLSLRAPSPILALKQRLILMATPSFIAGALLFFSVALVHGIFTSTKTLLPDLTPFFADRALADFDAAMHGGRDPWLYLRWLDPYTGYIQYLYSAWWSFLMIAISMAVCLWDRLRASRTQYLWTFLLCWVVLGNIVAGASMSAGPMFYERVLGDDRFADLIRHIDLVDRDGLSVGAIRDMLWAIYEGKAIGLGSGISAFPSLHVSMATLFALVAFRVHWIVGMVMSLFGVVIMVGSVHLAWHYAVDGYFSALATILIWQVVGWAARPSTAPGAARALSPRGSAA